MTAVLKHSQKVDVSLVEKDLSKLSSLLCKRAGYLYCYDGVPIGEEEEKKLRPSLDETSSSVADHKNPISMVNVSKAILE